MNTQSDTDVVDVPVVKVAKYPQYTTKDGHNDLALLYLERDVDFSGKIFTKMFRQFNPINDSIDHQILFDPYAFQRTIRFEAKISLAINRL